MVHAVLIASLVLPCAALAVITWRAQMRANGAERSLVALNARSVFMLDTVLLLIDASRRSSEAVVKRLAHAVLTFDPLIDTVLAFIPFDEELVCCAAFGARSDHFPRVRLRRDATMYLPSRAAFVGHRVTEIDGAMIPTDRRALAVPMRDENGLRAVIYCSSTDARALANEDAIVRAIEGATAPYVLALERETDRADATYDALTGLLTPRGFRQRLHDELGRVPAHGHTHTPYTLWFVDTDHFKSVNDTCGHAAGDTVLQTMAELLRAHVVPDVDLVARNGGDEFCALIHDAQKTIAIERAQALCEAVRRHDFGYPVTITASIGVATFPYDANSSSELLDLADAAMYHSKRSGRDRVSFALGGATFAVYR